MRALSVADFFRVSAREYEHLDFNAETATIFIWAICIGVLLAVLYNFYQRTVPGGVVRTILRAEAFDEARAKTAEELGLAGKAFALFELTSGITLRHVIQTAPAAEGDEDTAPRYYIPEEERYRAEVRFSKEGMSVMGFVITVVLTLTLAVVLIKLLPTVVGLFDGLSK